MPLMGRRRRDSRLYELITALAREDACIWAQKSHGHSSDLWLDFRTGGPEEVKSAPSSLSPAFTPGRFNARPAHEGERQSRAG